MAGDDYTEIPLRKAMTTLALDRHFHNNWTPSKYQTADDLVAEAENNAERVQRLTAKNPEWRDTFRRNYPAQFVVRHYSNHAVISGDLDMDREFLARETAVAGIVVDGDLELHGSILNWEIDTMATFLWVRGNLHCENLIAGCMHLTVDGNATVGNLLVSTYNHGDLLIRGDLHGKRVIIDDDGHPEIRGRVFAKGWNASHNAKVKLRRSEWSKEVRPEFRAEFLHEEGYPKHPNGNVGLVEALLAGREILRER